MKNVNKLVKNRTDRETRKEFRKVVRIDGPLPKRLTLPARFARIISDQVVEARRRNSGSAIVFPSRYFTAEKLQAAGETGYVLIRDTTCRLFGFHGVEDNAGGFSFDHMFGF